MIISADRFLSDLETLGTIGWVEGQGMDRAAYSPQYAEARSFVRRRMEAGGLATRVDGVGNLFGRIEGSEEGAPAIMAGSHLDAVPGGGKYDGPLGVVAALEAARSIREQGIAMKHPLEVAGFIAEEGGPLGGTFGSRALAGLVQELPPADLLARFGLSAESIGASRLDGRSLCCYLELHIEQGPTLERRGIPVGIPTGIVGISRYAVTVAGEANHAGTTPMKERKDAMRAAADLLGRWFRWVDTRDDLVCNVGVLSLTPRVRGRGAGRGGVHPGDPFSEGCCDGGGGGHVPFLCRRRGPMPSDGAPHRLEGGRGPRSRASGRRGAGVLRCQGPLRSHAERCVP